MRKTGSALQVTRTYIEQNSVVAWRHLQRVVRAVFCHAAHEFTYCRIWEGSIDFQCSLASRRVVLVLKNGCVEMNIAGRKEIIQILPAADGDFVFELRRGLFAAVPLVIELIRETATYAPFDLCRSETARKHPHSQELLSLHAMRPEATLREFPHANVFAALTCD